MPNNNRRSPRRSGYALIFPQPLGPRRPTTYAVHESLYFRQMNEQERRRRHSIAAATAESSSQSDEASGDSNNEEFQFALVDFTMSTTSAVVAATEEDTTEQCIICINTIQLNETIRVLRCKHKFHKSCIDKWLISHLQCPICRQNVTASPESESEDGRRTEPLPVLTTVSTVIDLTSPVGSPIRTSTPSPPVMPASRSFDVSVARPRSPPPMLPLTPPRTTPQWWNRPVPFYPMPVPAPTCHCRTYNDPPEFLPPFSGTEHCAPPPGHHSVMPVCPLSLPVWPAPTNCMWVPPPPPSAHNFLPNPSSHFSPPMNIPPPPMEPVPPMGMRGGPPAMMPIGTPGPAGPSYRRDEDYVTSVFANGNDTEDEEFVYMMHQSQEVSARSGPQLQIQIQVQNQHQPPIFKVEIRMWPPAP